MKLIEKQALVDDLLLAATERNTLTVKEVYEIIRKQPEVVLIVRR